MNRLAIVLGCGALMLAQPRTFGQAFIGANFSGGAGANIALEPPDTQGAAGIDHYVQFINGRFSIYNKSTAAQISSVSSLTFWQNAGLDTSNASRSDPRIFFDSLSNRWFVCQVDVIGGTPSITNNFLLGVSNSADPTQGFKAFRFSIGTNFGDFPTMGVDAQGLYLSTNNFPLNNPNTPINTTIVSIPKADLLLASPTIADRSQYTSESLNARGNVVQPAINFGPSPGHAALLAMSNTATTSLVRTTVFNSAQQLAGSATLSPSNTITIPPAPLPPRAQQPGGGTIDSVDNRLSEVFQLNGNLWVAQGTSIGGRAGIQWYKIDEATSALIQSGTISDPSSDFVMPSICANSNGDVVIGYTRSSSSSFPGSYASIGATGAGGTVSFSAPMQLKAGIAAYTGTRWGDYSGTLPDPADPGIFWTNQEWATTGANNWATQMTEIVINSSGEARWKSAASGTFSTASNWFAGAAPTPATHAIFSRSTGPGGGAYTVTLAGATGVDRLSFRQGAVNMNLNGATLSATNASAATPSLVVGEFDASPVVTFSNGTLATVNASLATSNPNSRTTMTVAATARWINSDSIYVGGSSATAGGSASLTVSSGATLSAGGTLRVWDKSRVTMQGTANVGAVTTSGAGLIDLTNSAMVVEYPSGGPSPIASIALLLTSGYAGGAWNGSGINSSAAATNSGHAMGFGEAASIFTSFPAPFAGFSVDDSAIVLGYTRYGDANLDLTVNLIDFNRLAASFGLTNRFWSDGDFNYDGTVNLVDFNLLAGNFGLSAAADGPTPQDWANLAAAVPEPASLVSALLLLPCIARRRA